MTYINLQLNSHVKNNCSWLIGFETTYEDEHEGMT